MVRVDDFRDGVAGLPPTDGLRFTMTGARVIVRPSGTEPKIKCYLQVVEPVTAGIGAARAAAQSGLAALRAGVVEMLALPAADVTR